MKPCLVQLSVPSSSSQCPQARAHFSRMGSLFIISYFIRVRLYDLHEILWFTALPIWSITTAYDNLCTYMPLRTFLIVKVVEKISVKLIFNGEMDSGVKMVFTVMLMFCTCHPAKQPVNTLSQEKHECQLFIVLWSYMSQVCKTLKGNVVKQGGKNKFYATSLFHPCMMHLVSPGMIGPRCVGIVRI